MHPDETTMARRERSARAVGRRAIDMPRNVSIRHAEPLGVAASTDEDCRARQLEGREAQRIGLGGDAGAVTGGGTAFQANDPDGRARASVAAMRTRSLPDEKDAKCCERAR